MVVGHESVASPRVVVIGPATWNHIIVLDQLPSPTPHMQFAMDHWWTLGGTSAGKTVHLADLGVVHTLVASIGNDDNGSRVREALRSAGVHVVEMPAARVTESHVNLMNDAGERVSLYVDEPPASHESGLDVARAAMQGAAAVVLDLASPGSSLAADPQEIDAEVWVDLHDWDGSSDFQLPFLRAANVVVASHERLADIHAFLRRCIDEGAELAIVTRGAAGSIGMDMNGHVVECAAPLADVIDTNGAGDAFVAGALAARLRGDTLATMLKAGSNQATRALSSRHLCASLEM
ncbi:carbohydrate kinase family protein [Demequina aurantiaca]|uniref:carbohydrate kinase family protein n=1 Tax=Demequina aurantiaca TaxID=676200 RepID=UPI000785EAFB|nr:carbohydrate kinase family protein [Demequina aurantiaca]